MSNKLFDRLAALEEEWRKQDEADVKRFRSEGLMDLDNGAWNDIWPVMDYNPPCLKCKTKLRYNYGLNLFQCPSCGAWIFANDYEYGDLPGFDDPEAIEALYR